MDCFFYISFLSFWSSCASCAAAEPRWVLWSLMNSREACNPYVSAHAGSMRSDLGKGCVLQKLPARIRMFRSHFSLFFICLHCTTFSVCYTHLFVIFLLLRSFSVSLCLSLPSRHADVSKLMGYLRAPLLCSDFFESYPVYNKTGLH